VLINGYRVYERELEKKGVKDVIVDLEDGSKGHWFGPSNAKYVYVYFHGKVSLIRDSFDIIQVEALKATPLLRTQDINSLSSRKSRPRGSTCPFSRSAIHFHTKPAIQRS
jgi:hypothetical protein